MKFAAMGLSVGVLVAALLGTGCSRHKQEAVILANQGDQIVDLDPNGAIGKYEQAVQLDPSNHRIIYKLAKAQKKKEEWDKVASTLARATDIAPSYANYWFERGMAISMSAEKSKEYSRYEDAKEPFKKCIEADPNKDECSYRLAIAYLYTDDEQQALNTFTKAIEHRPDEIGYYTRLADLYLRLGYDDEAEKVLNAAIEMANPKDKQLYNVHTLIAGIHRDKGDIEGMVKAFEAAKAVNQEDPGLLFNLGMAYSKLNPPKKAESMQMLKGFIARACKSQKANTYKTQCDQANSTIRNLQGAGT
ncbi:MAG: tetratricopeptide repeat protein [Polyangiaceae bacterium]